jgi:hypothetical protein
MALHRPKIPLAIHLLLQQPPTLTDTLSVLPSTPADVTRSNIKSVNKINYWCRILSCTKTRFRNAVIALGSLVADMQAYLNR